MSECIEDAIVDAAVANRMRHIRGKDTKPELIVRRLVHRLGFRFRLHRKDLPGSPDLVFPKLKAVIFVHGCFWHRHSCAAGRRIPRIRQAFWEAKFRRTMERDLRVDNQLQLAGWRTMTIWECEIAHELEPRLLAFLNKDIG